MSRRPPSARDPRNVGVTRTIPAVNRVTKGASASRLASPLPKGVSSAAVPPAGGGGGGVTGWAGYYAGFSATTIDSANVGYIHADAMTLDETHGDAGVYAAIPDGILLNPGFYVVTESFFIQPTTNAVSSDIHVVNYEFDTRTLAGTQPPFGAACTFTNSLIVPTGSGGDVSPGFQIFCTGGTDREYHLDRNHVYVTIVRFDLP